MFIYNIYIYNMSMFSKVKLPNYDKRTKVGKLLSNPVVISSSMRKINYKKIKKSYGYKSKDKYVDIINEILVGDGSKKYVVSGRVKLSVIAGGASKDIFRSYSFTIKANPNLSKRGLRRVITSKLMEEFERKARYGFSNIIIEALSFNSLQIPSNFKFHKNVRMFNNEYLHLRLFDEKLNNQHQKVDSNCLVDYLSLELSKFYKKKSSKKLIIDNLNKYCINVIKNGCSLIQFKLFMKEYLPCVHYTVLGPDFNVIMYERVKDKNDKKLVFYVNNSHVYPISNNHIQNIINKKHCNGASINKYFNELYEFEYYNDFIYMENPIESLDDFKLEGKTYILNENDSIMDVCQKFINELGYAIEVVDIDNKNGQINFFKHPIKDIIISNYNDYNERKEILEKLNKITGNILPPFKNQSYATISKQLMDTIDYLPPSYYNKETYYYFKEYEPKPIVETLKDCKKEDIYMKDISKHYSSIMYKWYNTKGVFIPIYDIHNNIEEYKGQKIEYGEYYIQKKKFKGISFGGCFYHYYVICELLEKGYITEDDIKYCITTKNHYKGKSFKKFIDYTKQLNSNEFKTLNNLLNGILKNHTSRSGKAYFTNDIMALSYLINDAEKNNKKYSWNTNETTQYHFLKTYTEKENPFNTSSFYRTCISFSILDTLNLINECSQYGEIVKVKTDAVYFIPDNTDLEDNEIDKNYFNNIGKAFFDIVNTDIFECDNKIQEFKKYEIIKKDTLILGSGGSGKSYKVINDAEMDNNILFLSASNNAVIELIKKAKEQKKYNPKWKFSTIAMFLHKLKHKSLHNAISVINNTYDKVIMDEFSMCPLNFLRVLINLNVPVIYVGDQCQLPPILKKNETSYDLSEYLSKWCNVEHKKFNPDFGRYDQKTYNILENFRNNGYTSNLLQKLKKIDNNKIYPFYLTQTNRDKDKYNKLCSEYFNPNGKIFTFTISKTEETKDADEEFSTLITSDKKKSSSYKLDNNAPIICLTNDKELKKIGIVNNWKGHIYSYTNEYVVIIGDMFIDGDYIQNSKYEITMDTFEGNFNPLYASTVHKFQGGKITTDYAIILPKYTRDRNSLYTSLSRCENYKQIYITSNIQPKYFWINHNYINKNQEFKIKYEISTYYIYKILKNGKYATTKEEINKKDIKLIKKIKCSRYCSKIITRNINDQNNKDIKKLEKPEIKQSYKYIIPKNPNKLVLYNGKLSYIYYENDERIVKTMKTKKNGVNNTILKMEKFIKSQGNEIPKIINKTNEKLVLSFC